MKTLLIFATVLVLSPCNVVSQTKVAAKEESQLNNLKRFFNASTVKEREAVMADDYHFFFNEKKGDGGSKVSSLESFQNWDGPLHPDIQITEHSFNNGVSTVKILEGNDFSKLIGYPGWKATVMISFDANDRIREVIYVPDTTQTDYRIYLNPALDWLKENMPDELNEVYRDKKLIRTERTAKRWVELLKIWKQNNQNIKRE